MTETDKPIFAAAMGKLCLALREKDPDAAQMRTYFDALKDLEIEFVTVAADALARSSEWFPKTSDWRSAAARVERDRTIELQARLRKLHTPLCLVCDDTGWDRRDDDRVTPCTCRSLRRLEILGRRPMPELPPAGEDGRELSGADLGPALEPKFRALIAKRVMP